MSVCKHGGRKWALGTHSPVMLPDKLRERRSLASVSDVLNNRWCFRVLTVMGNYTRECLTLVADTSLLGEWMI